MQVQGEPVPAQSQSPLIPLRVPTDHAAPSLLRRIPVVSFSTRLDSLLVGVLWESCPSPMRRGELCSVMMPRKQPWNLRLPWLVRDSVRVIPEQLPGEGRDIHYRSLRSGSSLNLYTYRLVNGVFWNF